MKQQYRIVKGRYLRRKGGVGEMLRPGDKFTPSSSMEVKKLGDQIVPVDEPVARRAAPAPRSDDAALVSTPAEGATPAPEENEAQAVAQGGKADPVTISEELGGGWFVLSTGEKVHGKAKALAMCEGMNNG